MRTFNLIDVLQLCICLNDYMYSIATECSSLRAGNLPIGEKYKYFLKVIKLFHMTNPLVKNIKISQFLGDLLDGEKYKDFLEVV